MKIHRHFPVTEVLESLVGTIVSDAEILGTVLDKAYWYEVDAKDKPVWPKRLHGLEPGDVDENLRKALLVFIAKMRKNQQPKV